MRRSIGLLLFITTLLYSNTGYKKYCSNNSLRNTHIIIDLFNIDKVYYGKIIKQIKFAPHEYVSINAFDPKSNTLKTIYNFCYPKYTKEESIKIKDSSSILRLTATRLETMYEDQMFINQIIIEKLSKLQKQITKKTKGNLLNALESYSKNISKYGRIYIFTNRIFNDKNSKLNLNGSSLYIQQKNIPNKNHIAINKKFFIDKYIDYKGINTRLAKSNEINSNLLPIEHSFNLIINKQKIKSEVSLLLNNKEIINGWIKIKGIIAAPIEGNVNIKKDSKYFINAKITNTKRERGNELRKNDKLKINIQSNNTTGKYYNYSYVFEENINNYFEYKVVK